MIKSYRWQGNLFFYTSNKSLFTARTREMPKNDQQRRAFYQREHHYLSVIIERSCVLVSLRALSQLNRTHLRTAWVISIHSLSMSGQQDILASHGPLIRLRKLYEIGIGQHLSFKVWTVIIRYLPSECNSWCITLPLSMQPGCCKLTVRFKTNPVWRPTLNMQNIFFRRFSTTLVHILTTA